MSRLLEIASSAFTAAAVITMAIGCALLGGPLQANQGPPNPCTGCIHGNCGPCQGSCEDAGNNDCCPAYNPYCCCAPTGFFSTQCNSSYYYCS